MRNVNNHIHTIYSFSPYTPREAVLRAKEAGLATVGLMDHDSVAGADEFLAAARDYGIGATIGFECRVSLAGTQFADKRVNNPDQRGVAYLAMHGIPYKHLCIAEGFLKPIRGKRLERNRKMVEKLNKNLKPGMPSISWEDVLKCSQYHNGGTVTERHILYSFAAAITEDEPARHFLLGMFKAQLMDSFYIDADDELPHISDFINLAEEIGAIPAYAYLGDVTNSVTGDKKAQEFEDGYLDELFAYLKSVGFSAVTYMPARNTLRQLARVMGLCERHGIFQISGEDINSPFQSFVCEKIETPEFCHLIDSAWALIGHEKMSELGLEYGMFSEKTKIEMPDLKQRIKFYAEKGKEYYEK
ncbi:MAG: PHP domain-containing protein [Defluviitaleaceae bacterium]|nr:PHP domain-containing protein [Defluviitaleaceae bacterium]